MINRNLAEQITATVIIPTTGDRKSVLKYSISSVLRQSIEDLECFVIGDGVDASTDDFLTNLCAGDPRLSYFPHKKHPRRGEEYRHHALNAANGRIVCYLCDRDLMLAHHVEHCSQLLKEHDIAVSMGYSIGTDNIPRFLSREFFGSKQVTSSVHINPDFQLSTVAHTLDAYRKLPHGWRTTPQNQFTDRFMWKQFLAQDNCRIISSPNPTLLYFKRGNHPGLSSRLRAKELKKWHPAIHSGEEMQFIHQSAITDGILQRSELRKKMSTRPILIFGKSPSELITILARRAKSWKL